MTNTLLSYNGEIIPKFLALATAKEILKDRMSEDLHVQECLLEIKELQDSLKALVEDKEPELTREIKDLNTDIGLACKAAAKGTPHKAAELKSFFAARAAEKVEVVVTKGELFAELTKEIS
jgi:hypothetical protein